MGTPDWLNEDLRQRAFQAIATANGDEQVALRILYEALSHLDASTLTADKTLIDRIKNSRQQARLVPCGPVLLQRLIFKFSDLYAQQDNELHQPETTMLARYLQALLLFCLHRSSRWIVVGMGQLVFSYSGPQVAEMTGRVIERDWDNSDRTRAKRKIMEYLQTRFTTLVPADTRPQEDKHFVPAPDQGRLREVLQTYLELYVPWGTKHLLLSPDDLDKVAADNFIELDGFHVFVDPTCFATLTTALGYPHWTERLRMPALLYSNCTYTRSGHRRSASLDNRISETLQKTLRADTIRRSTSPL